MHKGAQECLPNTKVSRQDCSFHSHFGYPVVTRYKRSKVSYTQQILAPSSKALSYASRWKNINISILWPNQVCPSDQSFKKAGTYTKVVNVQNYCTKLHVLKSCDHKRCQTADVLVLHCTLWNSASCPMTHKQDAHGNCIRTCISFYITASDQAAICISTGLMKGVYRI